jgi:hypothetical protein
MPLIRSQNILSTQRPDIRHVVHIFQRLDFANDPFNVHPHQYSLNSFSTRGPAKPRLHQHSDESSKRFVRAGDRGSRACGGTALEMTLVSQLAAFLLDYGTKAIPELVSPVFSPALKREIVLEYLFFPGLKVRGFHLRSQQLWNRYV